MARIPEVLKSRVLLVMVPLMALIHYSWIRLQDNEIFVRPGDRQELPWTSMYKRITAMKSSSSEGEDGQPLTHQDNLNAIHLFRLIAHSSIGPNGKCKMLQNTCGGHVTVTTSASRLLDIIKVTNPVLKLVVSAADSHLKCHGNHGLTILLLILELLSRSLKLEVPQQLVLDACRMLKQALLAHLQDCSLRVKVDFENLKVPILVVRSILCSKPASCLTQTQRDHISYLLIRGYLNSIPKETTASYKMGNIHFVSHSGLSPDHCQLLDGMLIESSDSKMADFPTAPLKCVLFHVSLSGDVDGGITEETWDLQDDLNIVESCSALILQMLQGLVSEEVALVACQKVIHPRAKKYLQDHGVLVLDRLGLLTFGALTELIGGEVIESFLAPLHPDCFGMLDAISVTTLHKKTYYHLVNGNSNVSTLLLHNYHEESLEELKHVCHQGINALRELLLDPFIFCGGGCLEVHLAAYARYWGKENIQDLMKTGATSGQVEVVTEALSKSLECVGTSFAKSELEMLTIGKNYHLGCTSDSFLAVKKPHQCSCGAAIQSATDPGLMITPETGSLQNADTRWTESPLSEIQRNSLVVADGGLSKQNAIKTALEAFITILNIDRIIPKT